MHEIVTHAPDIFAPIHDLVDAGTKRSNDDGRWENGVQFNPEGCLEVHAHSIDCPPTDKSDLQECAGIVTFEPFILEIGANWPNARRDADVEAILKEQMRVSESSIMENAIWTGKVTNDATAVTTKTLPHKLSGATGTSAVVAKTALQAIGKLEAKLLSDARAGGTLHMSPIEAVAAERLFIKKDGNLYTKTLGTKVIIGNYPTGSIVAHGGDIDYWLSEEFTFDTEDGYKKNEFYVRVERVALVIWNPCKVYEATITP